VGGCGGGDDAWAASAQSFIGSDAPIVGVSQNQDAPSSSFKVNVPESGRVNTTRSQTIPHIGAEYVQPDSRTEPFLAPQLIEPMNSISGKDVVLDVSNQRSPGEAHITGAVRIPSKSFLYDNGTLRPVSELVAQLGKAGISDKDAVVVYSDTFSSGEAAFVLWMLRYLGQESVQALDGGLQDWIAASLPLQTKENVRPQSKYVPHLRPELLSDYNSIKSGKAQTVDARTFQDYGKSRIPNAIFIGPESLLEGGRIKAASNLNDTFARLSRSQTVAVYSNDLLNASLVWYALQLMGFDSRIYTWQDWQAHEGARVS
jgi:thiosulfate/3-mercaptopyruvate sulfurtransferase